ncbi:hypothetical protein E4U32_005859 [Claviceps aff. humidiphila group G2b]|nr:hypothetical protein E4U32_005859 [Claviceps aff. humidiphila group G2b]
MDHKLWIDAIQKSPTAGYLNKFLTLAESLHVRGSSDLEGLSARDLRDLAILLLDGLRDHPAGVMLSQLSGKRVSDPSWVVISVTAVRCLKRLLAKAIDQADDKDLWKQVKKFISTNSQNQCADTPFSQHEALVANSSEHRKDVDHLMREDLGQIHVGISRLLQTFFPSSVDDLERTSKVFFKKCQRGRTPRYKDDTWTDWPTRAVEKKVFRWLKRFCKRLDKFARRFRPDIRHRRRLLGTRCETIDEYFEEKERLDVGFIDESHLRRGSKDGKHPWPQMLVPGVLNCSPLADSATEAWHDLAMVHDLRDSDEGMGV